MSTYIICTRCGRPMRPMYSDGTGAPTNGYCECAPATSWGDVPLIDWRDAELSRLRIQVEQMRIDAIKDREAFAAKLVIEADTLRTDLTEARADVARFEAALDVANRELAEAREKDAELASMRAENTVLRDTLVKANELHEKTIAGSSENERAWTAALAEANRERDEARADVDTLARSYLKPYARALKQDPDDGGYSATIIEFAGCYSEGETRDEALANIEDAATGWMLAALSMGQTIPEPMKYRSTIRALVVAARAMWDVVRMYEGDTEDDQLRRDIRASTVSFIKCAERGQAEKE